MNHSGELDWIRKVDSNKVYDALVKFAQVSNNESDRNHFVSSWNTRDWNEWRFGGDLGFGGKIWRGAVGFQGTGFEPTLYVSCYLEDENERRKKIIDDTNEELLKILTEARLL